MSKYLCYNVCAVFHGVLRTLDPKLMRGAEPVVRALEAGENLIDLLISALIMA